MRLAYRALLAGSSLLLLGACSKSEPPKDTTAAMAPAPAPAPPAAIALADVAGKWNFRNVPETGTDTSPTDFVLDAKPDTAGWSMTMAKSGLKVPLAVSTSADTLMLKAGPFASQRRKNVKVTTDTWLRMENGMLVGKTTAHYTTKGADSVLVLRAEGNKAP
jgi:hypothetical protein